MSTPRKSAPQGQQGSMHQYFRSSQQHLQPSVEDGYESDGPDEIPPRAPEANMTRPSFHTNIPQQNPVNEDLSHSQLDEQALRADIERVYDEQDAEDGTYELPIKRKSDGDAGPSSTKKSKLNPSAAKPYEQCCVEVRAKRDELIHKIGRVWGKDYTSWPTHAYAPARANVVLEPRDWGKPILLKVEELTRAANNKFSARAALTNAINARQKPAGERIWMTTGDIDAAINSLLSKEPVRVSAPCSPQVPSSEADEDIEVAKPIPRVAQSLNAMPVDTPAPEPPAQLTNPRAKQQARIDAVLASLRHLDTQTLRNVAFYMIEVADAREEHEKDLKKKEDALARACFGWS